jgi:CRISPR-associated protein Csx17
MLEGAILFAGALGRKIEHYREPSARFPFLFQSSPVGPGSSYFGESSGRELWLPLWRQQTPLVELRSLLSEGRIEKHGKMVKRGADAFVAAAQLGFDRGIDEFQRIGFFKGRVGGDNYFTAIDQGRIKPARNEKVDLLRECDEWLVALHFAKAGEKCPVSVRGAAVDLERQIVNLATNAEMGRKAQMQGVLIGLGAVERAMARSYEWAKDQISPLTGLSADWKEGADDDSPEFRLAASLASMSAWLGRGDGKGTFWLRSQLEPVDIKTGDSRVWLSWLKNPSNDVTWHDGDLTDCLNAIMARRIQRVEKAGCEGWPDWSPCYARLDDITDFIEGRIDPALLADLVWGLSLIDWQTVGHVKKQAREQEQAERITYDWRDDEEYRHRTIPSSFYALLKLCFRHKNDGIPIEAAIHQLARSGKGQEASRIAARRLRASGEAPLVTDLPVAADVARRTAAALLFPISRSDMKLLKLTLQHHTQEQPA